ncbi:hypothetical protein MUK42_37659 [Musa troglodytarum]|uniref:Uncharacterized protein n=1 Tax=Musa troglodytarum TaxID=320322 RepID=A0A9E7GCH5_9LILI|nr:hypothetical protein MUK42_37659 [Musa troglodytarum]
MPAVACGYCVFLQVTSRLMGADEQKDNGAKRKKHHADYSPWKNYTQILYPEDYILKKIFRKHGPVLGIEFNPPGDAFGNCTGVSCFILRHIEIFAVLFG